MALVFMHCPPLRRDGRSRLLLLNVRKLLLFQASSCNKSYFDHMNSVITEYD